MADWYLYEIRHICVATMSRLKLKTDLFMEHLLVKILCLQSENRVTKIWH